MMLLACLANLIINVLILVFVMWALQLILGFLWPGGPALVPWGYAPGQQPNRFVSAVYVLVGMLLLINFLMCALGDGALIPPLYHGGYGMR
jgi:hypothetical protein